MAQRPRTGRPPRSRDPAGDPAQRALLVAPLLAPSVRWTSRSVAGLTGCTQSAVARAWAHSYGTAATDLDGRLPAAGLRLAAAVSHPGGSLLVLTGAGPATPVPAGRFMRAPRRPALQTLLATALLAADRGPGQDGDRPRDGGRNGTRDGDRDLALLADLVARLGRSATVHVVSSRPLDGAPPGAVLVPGEQAWQGLLAGLVQRCTRSPEAELLDAQHQAMEWARSDRPRFEWTVDRPAGTRGSAAGPPPSAIRTGTSAPAAVKAAVKAAAPATAPTGAGLPDDILEVLLRRIRSGRLTAGGRVTEAFLARSLRASRSQVRDALRTLASSGLIDLEPHRGAVVPTPQTADVVETYAARRALGAIVVRRACRWTPGSLRPVEEALQVLVETGRTGDSWATGEADLRLQDTLAVSTGMRRLPPLFRTLTAQLRLFIAVLGLDYTYSVTEMVQDDTALMERIRARDEAGAVRVWHRKVDDAADYMTSQLAISELRRRRRPG